MIIDWLLRVIFGIWVQDNDTHGDDKVTIINPNQLPPAIVDSWKGPLPGPLTVALDYIKREFDDGFTSYWITGMDREGTYYAVKLNPCIAVTTFGCKANYLAWIQRYDYAGFTPV